MGCAVLASPHAKGRGALGCLTRESLSAIGRLGTRHLYEDINALANDIEEAYDAMPRRVHVLAKSFYSETRRD